MLDFKKFINNSPTSYHAVSEAEHHLIKNGFKWLNEKEDWNALIMPGCKYYVIRNGSIAAFTIPSQGDISSFYIMAAHSDSPTFKIKENPEISDGCYVKLDVEKYGGMILSTWLDRPLSIAGRIFYVNSENKLAEHFINIDKDLVIIPNLAIHMNPETNNGVAFKVQSDMLPVLFAGDKTLMQIIEEQFNIPKDRILGSDLYLYNREEVKEVGLNGELICGPRLDNLISVCAIIDGISQSSTLTSGCNMALIFDNEEVGSNTMQGADSTFFRDILVRLTEAMGKTDAWLRQTLANSFMISCDNAHAKHPAHPEKADPKNAPLLNKGIAIKYHGSQQYATDGRSAAMLIKFCNNKHINYQKYFNNSDIRGGSTLGNISNSQASINMVDIGIPSLAMHSSYETIGAEDCKGLYELAHMFYQFFVVD